MNNKEVEKRLFPRRLMNARVIFEDEFGEGLIFLYAKDISQGGVYLTSDIPIKLGSYVFLSFRLPESAIEIRGTGKVVRMVGMEAGDASPSGMGIRFVGLSQKAIQAIQEYVG